MGALTRIGNAIRGCIYGALGLEAFRLARGLRGSNRDQVELWTARILDWPFGGHHDPKVDWSAISSEFRPLLKRVCRFGVAIRAGILITLGVFLARAALTHDPNQAAGPRESILRLGGLFDGRWFLAVIGAGLVAYAVDQAIHAHCRRIRKVL